MTSVNDTFKLIKKTRVISVLAGKRSIRVNVLSVVIKYNTMMSDMTAVIMTCYIEINAPYINIHIFANDQRSCEQVRLASEQNKIAGIRLVAA